MKKRLQIILSLSNPQTHPNPTRRYAHSLCVRQRFGSFFSVLDEDGKAHLVAFNENAVYGLELAFPESDDNRYQVNALRRTPSGWNLVYKGKMYLRNMKSSLFRPEFTFWLRD